MLKTLLGLMLALFLAPAAALANSYNIQPGDVLQMEVLEDPSLNRSLLVLPDGTRNSLRIQRLNRSYALLSGINEAVVRLREVGGDVWAWTLTDEQGAFTLRVAWESLEPVPAGRPGLGLPASSSARRWRWHDVPPRSPCSLPPEGASQSLGAVLRDRQMIELVIDQRVDAKGAFGRKPKARGEFDVDWELPVDGEPAADTRSYAEKLADCVEEHVLETDGGAFVLFTSFATLNAVARRLRPGLESRGMPLLAQGADGSREDILRRFREDPRSVLLGAASFWQGVDVRGRGLRNVIITKLPFDPPDRPLTEARGELIQSRGGNPFMEDAIPRAVIRFKQGFGRLIRSREDHGRVVVLDGRLVTARYGRLFLSALPPGVPVRRVP